MTTALVTGAARGIGFELCRQLAARGERVIAACRTATPELRALPVDVFEGIDVTDDTSVAGLARRIGDTTLDTLVNNAGIFTEETLADLDFTRIRQQFEVNTLGPLRVTHALLERLTRGSRIAIVTSRMGSVGDNGSGGYYGYRVSKAGVNMIGRSLARDLRERGVLVAIIHPGMVATGMTRYHGIPPEESARGVIARIDGVTAETSGSFWHANGERLPW